MDNIFITIALLLAGLLVFAKHLFSKHSNLPPTIFPTLPIIGHLYLLNKPLHRSLAKISAKYGSILFLRFGSHRVLLVNSPSATEECLTKNDIILANRPRWLYGKILASNYSNLSWAPYGDHWRNLRRISTIEIFSSHRLNEFHDVRAKEGRLLVQKLINECSSSSSSPAPATATATVNLNSAFHNLTFNVLMRMISGEMYFEYGRDLEEKRKQFQEIVKEMFQVADFLNLEDHLPILRWLGIRPVEKRMIALQKKRNTFFQKLVDELREVKGVEAVNRKKHTMIEVLFQQQETNPNYYTDDLIKIFLLNLLAAGTDGPVSTMEWAFSLLLNHTHVLKKAQKEIDTIVGTHRLFDESDIANLPYLRCVINETLRLYPPTPLLLPHQSSEDFVVGGYHIPRGTILLVNQWGIQHDPELWSDPERFNPERFAGLDGASERFKFMPFGAGRRVCPGDGLSMRVIGLTLGLLIQCFDWERISEEMVDMSEGHGLTMPKAESLFAKCRPRPMAQDLVTQSESIVVK